MMCVMAGFAIHAAQDQPPRQPFQTDVNYVRVDMYPTIDGKPLADLAAADVEIFEDGVPQKIAQFEHVAISGPRPQTTRREPASVAEMQQAARDPRARLFVLFLDPRHVEGVSSLQIRKPLVDAINRLVGGDDLIAVMTPAMSARALTFTRRTTSIESLLSKYWGEKEWAGITDPIEFKYEACYPDTRGEKDIALEMIRRRREKLTLDALEDLSEYLRTLREERKAVMTISEGWPLYGPNRSLARPIKDASMPIPPIVVDPRTGRPTAADPTGLRIDYATCENDRLHLSEINHEERFLRILQAANRGNTSFYPIDPRGFVAQGGLLQARASSLRTMAEVTDGLAVVDAVGLEAGLQRIVDDLSSYYLLGYYSPAKPDGRFHRITVKVKRPGVDVRARSGYLAAKAGDAPRPNAPAISAVDIAEAQIVTQALGTLSAFTRERSLRVQAASGWTAAGDAVVWVVTEVSRTSGGDDWSKGGNAEVKLVDFRGTTLALQEVPLPASVGPMSARVVLKPTAPMVPGEYQVQVRARSAGALPASDTVRISLGAPPDGSGTLFNRRGITTGNREAPTADLRFRRNERLIVLLPTLSTDAISARLLDRTGKPLPIPVTAAIRDDADGSRWRAAELALAPLASGDYLIELTAPAERTITAFRVLP